jgi:quercetin dioxygenase-like cupin family protein
MKREYTSILGFKEGASRLHAHVTEIVPETKADRKSHYIHSHAAEEAFFILEGRATFNLVDGTQRTAGPGDLIFYPSGREHGEFEILSDRLRYLVVRAVQDEDPPCCCGGDRRRDGDE